MHAFSKVATPLFVDEINVPVSIKNKLQMRSPVSTGRCTVCVMAWQC